MDSAKSVFLSVLRTTFYGFFKRLSKNALLWMIILFGAKTPESSKICQTAVAFSYLVSTPIFTYFWKIFLTKNWKCFFVKISPLKNFINVIRDVTCNELLTTLVNLCDKRVSICNGCNGPVKNCVLPFPPPYDLVIVTKIRREYCKDRKETDFWTIKCILSCILRESVYLSIQVCSKLHDAIPNG